MIAAAEALDTAVAVADETGINFPGLPRIKHQYGCMFGDCSLAINLEVAICDLKIHAIIVRSLALTIDPIIDRLKLRM